MRQVLTFTIVWLIGGFTLGLNQAQSQTASDWTDVAIYASEINSQKPQLGLQVVVPHQAWPQTDVVQQIDTLRDDLYQGVRARPKSLDLLKCNHPACDGTMHMMTSPVQRCNHPACDGTMRVKSQSSFR